MSLTFGTAPSGVTYGEAAGTHSVSATPSPNVGTVTYSSQTSGVCAVDSTTGALTIVAAGTCTIAADDWRRRQPHSGLGGDTDFSVNEATMSLTFGTAPSGVTYGEAAGTHSVSATPSPNVGTVTYSSQTSGVCAVDSTTGA